MIIVTDRHSYQERTGFHPKEPQKQVIKMPEEETRIKKCQCDLPRKSSHRIKNVLMLSYATSVVTVCLLVMCNANNVTLPTKFLQHQEELLNKSSSSSQKYLERHNFGKRIHGQDSLLSRTIRQLQSLTQADSKRNSSHKEPSKQTQGDIRKDYETTKLVFPSSSSSSASPQTKKDSIVSNLFKFRPQLKPNPFIDSLVKLAGANFTNQARTTSGLSSGLLDGGEGKLEASYQAALGVDSEHLFTRNVSSLEGKEWWTRDDDQENIPNTTSKNTNSTRHQDFQVVDLSANHNSNQSHDQQAEPSIKYPQMASTEDITQVIRSKNIFSDEDGKFSNSSSFKSGRQFQEETGDKLRAREEFKKVKSGQEGRSEQAGSGNQDAKKEAKWLKDLGHHKHGWKNVYHKEEYAQHQKYHDVFRDKDWNNEMAKSKQNYHYSKGDKFKDTLGKSSYDKERRAEKYAKSKGDEWKRSEDQDEDRSNSELGNEHERLGAGGSATNIHQLDRYPPIGPNLVSPDHEERHSFNDQTIIEEMKNKLDKLSEQPEMMEQEQYRTQVPRLSGGQEDSPRPYESINDILKTTRHSEGRLGGANHTLGSPSTNKASFPAPIGFDAQSEDEEEEESYEGVSNRHEGRSPSPLPRTSEAKSENRKNELRLKLELDLGKSIDQSSKPRRNLTSDVQLNLANHNKGWLPSKKSPAERERHSWRPSQTDQNIHDAQLSHVKRPQQYATHFRSQEGPSVRAKDKRLRISNLENEFKPLANLTQVAPGGQHFIKSTQMGFMRPGKPTLAQDEHYFMKPVPEEKYFLESPVDSSLGDLQEHNNRLSVADEAHEMLAGSPIKNKEYMLLFGGIQSSSRDHSPAETNRQRQLRHHEEFVNEPRVIFEASSSNLIEAEAMPQTHLTAIEDDRINFRTMRAREMEALVTEPTNFAGVYSDAPLKAATIHLEPHEVIARQQFVYPMHIAPPQMHTSGSNPMRFSIPMDSYKSGSSLFTDELKRPPLVHQEDHGSLSPVQQAFGKLMRLPSLMLAQHGQRNTPVGQNLQLSESRPIMSRWIPFVTNGLKPLTSLGGLLASQAARPANKQFSLQLETFPVELVDLTAAAATAPKPIIIQPPRLINKHNGFKPKYNNPNPSVERKQHNYQHKKKNQSQSNFKYSRPISLTKFRPHDQIDYIAMASNGGRAKKGSKYSDSFNGNGNNYVKSGGFVPIVGPQGKWTSKSKAAGGRNNSDGRKL